MIAMKREVEEWYKEGGGMAKKPKPNRWDTHIEPRLTEIEGWVRDGLIDEQIIHNLGIAKATFYKYRDEHPELAELLKRTKAIVDIEVENALLKKALGFTEVIKKPIKVKHVIYDQGRKVEETERVIYADEEVYIAPDTTAQIFWLKNRKPNEWRDKKEVGVSLDKSLEDFFGDE